MSSMYFRFRSRRIGFITKVTGVHKATTAVNDASLCSTNLVVFLEFHPGRPGWNFPYEQTTTFDPVTKPARLPGSYEEALSERGTTRSLAKSMHHFFYFRHIKVWIPWPLLLADFRSLLFPLPHLLALSIIFNCIRSRTNDSGKRCLLHNIDVWHSKSMYPIHTKLIYAI